MRALVLAVALSAACTVSAQDLHPSLQPLAGLLGDWAGTAEAMTPSGPQRLHQTEAVRVELGGNLLVVEGLGRRLGDDGEAGEIVFNAFGVFSVDAATGEGWFDAFTQEGRHTRVQPVVVQNGFDWSIEPENGPRIEYQMRFDDAGRWIETGRMTFDDGATWRPFFEMTLARVEAD